MFDIKKALQKVNGTLIDFAKYSAGGEGEYPSARVLVHIPDNKYHPYVVWTAVDPSKDGQDPFFVSGTYRETLKEGYEALC